MSTLSTRIKSLHRRSANAGRDYLLIFCECVENMESNWTPMAELLAGANPRDAQVLRKLAGFVLSGWSVSKDNKHRTGLRFKKADGATFDMDKLGRIKALAEQGNVLQGKAISELMTPEKVIKAVSSEDLAKAYLASAHKKIDDGAISSVDALNALRQAIKALEAEVAAEAKAKLAA